MHTTVRGWVLGQTYAGFRLTWVCIIVIAIDCVFLGWSSILELLGWEVIGKSHLRARACGWVRVRVGMVADADVDVVVW